MNRKQLIKAYIEFFKTKKHKEIPNSSLIPENDPTVLFTSAGMHPLVPYLSGQKHPQGSRLVNVQKCIRTGDIEEVGDEGHHTFFEMLGNWSLGDYWKKEAIEYSVEFLTKTLKIPKGKISVTCFKGEKNIPKDAESAETWKEVGIPTSKIKFLGRKDNWWGPAGKTGPCGPDSEMFVDGFEIWNDVFMEYNKDKMGIYLPAKQKNVDTGMGVERTLTILNGLKDNYLTEVWQPIIKVIESHSKKTYSKNKKPMRIIADHVKASVFILGDGILPGNKEQGYVLRRLIRRAVKYSRDLGIKSIVEIASPVFTIYDDYKELNKNKKHILEELEKEEVKFLKTLEKGLNRFKKFTQKTNTLSGKDSFLLFQSFGFPIEMLEEEANKSGVDFSRKDFDKAFQTHQKLSRTATAGKFKSGLADHSDQTTKLHTAAHLLLAALRKVLKSDEIHQKGSNINPERIRLDFSFNRQVTKLELKKIEDLINSEIKKGTKVEREEMSLTQAKKLGALGSFNSKYGNKISVYAIGSFSKEICAGPHVNNIKSLGKFKIIKEESVGSGARRIKAILE